MCYTRPILLVSHRQIHLLSLEQIFRVNNTSLQFFISSAILVNITFCWDKESKLSRCTQAYKPYAGGGGMAGVRYSRKLRNADFYLARTREALYFVHCPGMRRSRVICVHLWKKVIIVNDPV